MATSPSPIGPEGTFAGLRWSAIVRGAVLDIVLTTVALIPIFLWFAGAELLSESEEISERAFERAAADPKLMLCNLVVGHAITVYASFWAARRAGCLHLRHGGWTAVASTALALLSVLILPADAGPPPPWWYDVLSYGLVVPAGILGGWLAARAAPRTGAATTR